MFDRGGGSGTVVAGSGNDLIGTPTSGGGGYVFSGGPGNDTITAFSGNDTVSTGSGSNLIGLGTGNNLVDLSGNNDTVVAGSGNDPVTVSGSDNALVFGGSGQLTFLNGSGPSTVVSGTGSETIQGGVTQFIQQDQVLAVQLLLQTLHRSFLSRFQQLGHQAGRGVKAHPFALAGRRREIPKQWPDGSCPSCRSRHDRHYAGNRIMPGGGRVAPE